MLRRFRSAVLCLMCATLLSPLLNQGTAHAAATLPSLWVTPTSGTDTTAVTVVTSGSCTQGTNLIGRIFGPGFPAAGQIAVSNSPTSAYDRTQGGGYVVPLTMTVRDLLSMQPRAAVARGEYRVVVACRDAVRAREYATFTGALHFDASSRFAAPAPPKAATELAPADPSGGSEGSSTDAQQPTDSAPALATAEPATPRQEGTDPELDAASRVAAPHRGSSQRLPMVAVVMGGVAVLLGVGLVLARRRKPTNGVPA